METAECGDRVEGVGCGGEQDLHSFQPMTYDLLVNGVPGHFFEIHLQKAQAAADSGRNGNW